MSTCLCSIVVDCDPSCVARNELAESRKRKKVVPKSNYRDKYEHLIGGADDVARVGSTVGSNRGVNAELL